jgi:hypothetical protein
MTGLVPVIHVDPLGTPLTSTTTAPLTARLAESIIEMVVLHNHVDGRDKPGHDDVGSGQIALSVARAA